MTPTQNRKLQELLNCTQLVLTNTKFGIEKLSFSAFWVVGGVLRDLLLQPNPDIRNYDYYVQTCDREMLTKWSELLTAQKIPHTITVNDYEHGIFNKDCCWGEISLSLLEFQIEYEVKVIMGKLPPQEFISQNICINLSQIGLDILQNINYINMSIALDSLINQIWMSPAFMDGYTKKILKLTNEHLITADMYNVLVEPYLTRILKRYQDYGYKLG